MWDTSCIVSLEAGGLLNHVLTSRLTSSGLAQGCAEGEEDREEGAEGEEVEARDLGAFLLQLSFAEVCSDWVAGASVPSMSHVKSIERDLCSFLHSRGSSVALGEQGEEVGWREECGGHEEGGQGDLRAEDAVAGPGGDLRQEGDAAHRGPRCGAATQSRGQGMGWRRVVGSREYSPQ